MKALVFDSSSLISIASTCLIKIAGRLAEEYKGSFYITESVERESVLRPLKIKRFELNALRIKGAVKDGWLKVYRNNKETEPLTEKILGMANKCFFAGNRAIKLIQMGEAESLALFKLIGADALVIDERTTRQLLEDALALQKHISRRYKKEIRVDMAKVTELKEFLGEVSMVRSTELIALAFERNLFPGELIDSKESAKAALYALKFSGCGISAREINSYLKGIK